MAKRGADAQITKEDLSDGDGLSDGSQMGGPRRATAAQMAARRLARPRGGRRPGTTGHARPLTSSIQPLSQPNNTNNVNGIQQQQNPFGSLNGGATNPSGQISQSFPPFGGSSNSGLTTQFTAPSSSGFSFSARTSESFNNPFAKHYPPDNSGFQGRIFNLPPTNNDGQTFVREQTGHEAPQFAANAPFLKQNQDSAKIQQESSDKQITMAPGQQQPGQTGSGLFSQFTSKSAQPNQPMFSQPASSQNQATRNMFAGPMPPTKPVADMFAGPSPPAKPTENIFAGPQPPTQPVDDIFAKFRKSESQSQSPAPANNMFGQNTSIFQQAKSNQQVPNFFAHLGTPQPSVGLGQSSTSPTEDQSMMSTSPDTSPSTRPFGVLTGSNNQSQASPTKGTDAPTTSGNLFDRISKPMPENSTQPTTSSPQEPSGASGAGGSLFDRISRPASDATSPASGASIGGSFSQEGSGGLFGRVSNQTTETVTQPISKTGSESPSRFQQTPTAQPSNQVLPRTAPPAKKPLFGQTLPPGIRERFSAEDQQRIMNKLSKSSNVEQVQDITASGKKRKFDDFPDIPGDYSEVEKKQLRTGYRLKHFDECMRKKLASRPPVEEMNLLAEFYEQKVASIRRANGGPLETIEEMVKNAHKRKAEDKSSWEVTKKPRMQSPSQAAEGPSSKGQSQSGSQTSSLFKNVLDCKVGQSTANGSANGGSVTTGASSFQPSSTSQSGNNVFLPSKLEVKPSSTSAMAPPPKPTANFSSNAFPSGPAQGTNSSSTISNMFGSKNGVGAPTSTTPTSSSARHDFGNHAVSNPPSLTTSTSTITDTPKPPQFSLPKFGVNNAAANGEKASQAPAAPMFGSEASKSKLAPNPVSSKSVTDKAVSSGSSNTLTGTPALKVPVFAPVGTSNSAGSNSFQSQPSTGSNPSSGPPKAPPFKVPSFGTAGSAPNFMAQFGKAAEETAKKVKAKRKAEEYDSEEEDEATWERRYEEEQRVKKQKFDAASETGHFKLKQGQQPSVNGPNEIHKGASSDKMTNDSTPSIFEQSHKPSPGVQNIFGHLSGSDSGAEGSKTGDADDEDEEEYGDEEEENDNYEEGNEDDDEEVNTSQSTGRSLFDRITKDEHGKPMRETSDAGMEPAVQLSGMSGRGTSSKPTPKPSGFEGDLFGRSVREDVETGPQKPSSSSPKHIFGQVSTPPKDVTDNTSPSKSPSEEAGLNKPSSGSPKHVFGQVATPFKNVTGNTSSKSASEEASSNKPSSSSPTHIFGQIPQASEGSDKNHTWKPSTPITFASVSNSSEGRVLATSSAKSPFTGLFGAPKNSATTESPEKPIFNSLFAPTPAKPPVNSLGFNFAPTKSSTNSLAPPSGGTSRATSPGATTGESANESGADHDDGHAPPEAQLDLVSGGPGEENEDVIFKIKAKALKWDAKAKDWVTQGLGPLRVLQHAETSVTRILMRHDPSGRIVINSYLLKGANYEKPMEKSLRIPVVEDDGKVVSLLIRVGKDEAADELREMLMGNRPS